MITGFMYYPWTLHDRSQLPPDQGLKDLKVGLKYPLPEVYCDGSQGVQCSTAISKKGWSTDWFTNYTFITTEPTQTVKPQFISHPWAAPGTAFTVGEGCGANGGNPYPLGCNHPDNDTNPFGTCCSQKPGSMIIILYRCTFNLLNGNTDSTKINRPEHNIRMY